MNLEMKLTKTDDFKRKRPGKELKKQNSTVQPGACIVEEFTKNRRRKSNDLWTD